MKILNLVLLFLFFISSSYSQSSGDSVVGRLTYNSYTGEARQYSIETEIIFVKKRDNSIDIVIQPKGHNQQITYNSSRRFVETNFLDKKMYTCKTAEGYLIIFDTSEFYLFYDNFDDPEKIIIMYLSDDSTPKSYAYVNKKAFVEFFLK